MTQAQGSRSYLAVQKETTFNTSPATPALIKVPFSSESLSKSVGIEENDHLFSGRNAQAPRRGTVDVGGGINFNLGFYPGNLLYYLLGDVATTAPTHTIKVGSALPSFVIEKGFADIGQYFLYKGCKAKKLSLAVTPSGFQKCSLEIMGASETVSTTAFDSTLDTLGDSPLDGAMIAAFTEGGVSATGITSLSIDIENDLDGDTFTLAGGGSRGSIGDGRVKVSGNLKGFFENTTLYNKAVNATESSLAVTFTAGTGAGTAGNEQLVITIPELIYSVKTPAISGPKGIYYELDWQAYYGDGASASSVVMVLKNTQTAINA